MANSPNTDNYTLGKGVVSFNKKDKTSGLYTGERDLGNAPAFSFSVAIEKLEHYSSRGGLRAKDKEIISQITPGLSFTLDEINEENLALLTIGTAESVTQAAAVVTDEVVTAHAGRAVQLSKRKIGVTTLSHGTVTSGPFVVGTTVTGTTSNATGVITTVGAGFIQVATAGTFNAAEEITSDSVSATTNAAPVWVPGVLKVTDSTGTTTYEAGAGKDYLIDTNLKDDTIGRIWILEGGAIDASGEGESIKVTFGCAGYTYRVVRAFKETQVEGFLRFVSDNPAGGQRELRVWRCSLTPTGDTALIGEDWATLGFTGEILKDETHSESPYMDIVEL